MRNPTPPPIRNFSQCGAQKHKILGKEGTNTQKKKENQVSKAMSIGDFGELLKDLCSKLLNLTPVLLLYPRSLLRQPEA